MGLVIGSGGLVCLVPRVSFVGIRGLIKCCLMKSKANNNKGFPIETTRTLTELTKS